MLLVFTGVSGWASESAGDPAPLASFSDFSDDEEEDLEERNMGKKWLLEFFDSLWGVTGEGVVVVVVGLSGVVDVGEVGEVEEVEEEELPCCC